MVDEPSREIRDFALDAVQAGPPERTLARVEAHRAANLLMANIHRETSDATFVVRATAGDDTDVLLVIEGKMSVSIVRCLEPEPDEYMNPRFVREILGTLEDPTLEAERPNRYGDYALRRLELAHGRLPGGKVMFAVTNREPQWGEAIVDALRPMFGRPDAPQEFVAAVV